MEQMGILFSEGCYWQALRQAWQGMFHPDRWLQGPVQCSHTAVLTAAQLSA